jgi:isopenicillin N synthase-like dioxygenase
MTGMSHLRIIDVAALVDRSATAAARKACAEEIGAACLEVGFFYVANHGIPESDRTAMLSEAKRFFDLSVAEKMRLHIRDNSKQFRGYVPLCGEVTAEKRDWHECLDLQPLADRRSGWHPDGSGTHILDDPGQWPQGLAEFSRAAMKTWDNLSGLADRLVEGLALSLDLDAPFFKRFTGPELCDLRLSHYPPYPTARDADDVDLGMGAHYDLGFLAILTQNAVGGLEVMNKEGRWIDAPRLPGTYLIHVGLMVQRWTNDRYQATLHRVRLPGDRDRYSIPFFYEPKPSAIIAPLDVCCSGTNPPRYEPCHFGEFLSRQFAKAYHDRPVTPT